MSEDLQPEQAQFYSGTPLGKRETTYAEQRFLKEIIYGEDPNVEVEVYEDGAVLNYDGIQEQLGETWYELEGVEHLIVSDSKTGLQATIDAHLENNREPITSDYWSKPLGGTTSSY